VFHALVVLAAAATPVLLVGIVVLLAIDAWPAITRFGFGFLMDSAWDPVAEKFGAAAYAYGTVITSVLALLIAGPIGVACAIFIAEYSPRWLAEPVSFLIQLLAAIPSIIYGL
jgi:phosphate transport system permease protein